MDRSTRVALEVAALMLLLPAAGTAQDAPSAGILAGVGNALGWFGGQVEAYAAEGRISGFLGLGYMPNILNDEGNGVAGAVGVRGFTAGERHRALLEVSVTALSTWARTTVGSGVVESGRNYGPGVAVGYQFIGDGGLTVMFTVGAGLDSEELNPEGSRLQPTLGVGVGYTWR